MTTDIVNYIADNVKSVTNGFNCLLNIARKFDEQPVILNGRYAGMQDGDRVSGYIRFREEDNDHQYQNIEDSGARKFKSCGTDGVYIVAVPLRMVIVHRFKDEMGFENAVASIMAQIDFSGYSGEEKDIRVILEASTTSKEYIYFEELGEKQEGDDRIPPEHVNLVMFDFSIGYRKDFCSTSNFNENECL